MLTTLGLPLRARGHVAGVVSNVAIEAGIARLLTVVILVDDGESSWACGDMPGTQKWLQCVPRHIPRCQSFCAETRGRGAIVWGGLAAA